MTLQKRRNTLIGVLSVICIILSIICWWLFDVSVDRSGWVFRDGVYSYRDFHGHKVTGWQDIDGSRYYFDQNKAMVTRWLEMEGQRYHFAEDGTLDIHWFQAEGNRYYSDDTGAIQTGWQDIEFQRYYMEEDGRVYTGWMEQDGSTYYFGQDGAMALGFTPIEDKGYYFGEDGVLHTGTLKVDDKDYLFGEDGVMYTGWLEQDGTKVYYIPGPGHMATGWQEIEGKRYYFGDNGLMQTGWLQLGEYSYYLQSDGSAAVGPSDIEGTTYYFTPKGIHVVLVNADHKVPDYYKMNLVTAEDIHRVSDVCLEPLKEMLSGCLQAGIQYTFNSAYRSIKEQTAILEYRTREHEEKGLDPTEAYMKARETVALPGTSEHHLGLAVDLLGDEAVAWFTEHCWDYGFIVRYTEDKKHITGIIDEPWHFRYVGREVSLDMKDSGLCLEEYLGAYPTS